MGWERISYKEKHFDCNNGLISWVQKFMELYLSKLEHPKWFNDFLEYISWNFHVPHGKVFFEESMINDNKEKLEYALKMIDLTIKKMESMNKREFIEYIRNDLKGTWCDLEPASFYDGEWLDENETYEKYSLEVLRKLKEIMS